MNQENNEEWTVRKKWNSGHTVRHTKKQEILLKKRKKSINK
jgi:hypothetical protein